jgi:hypothetical protein
VKKVPKPHDRNAISNREVQEATERCKRHISECDEKLRRYEKQVKDAEETMKRGDRIN